ncbi:MAG: FAD-dependent oxidoreductase [Planctomycetota bacterium]|jgi:NADPH-dependent glutamate synthase beta subunit-like oxidoreductase
MPKLVIDNRETEVDAGVTILDAAGKLGIEIPTMCFLKGCPASTSCMVCVVKVNGLNKLVPACGTIAEDGMRVESNSEEVREARKAALELLLSDHLGDCEGPCEVTCPAKMNIPLMIRQIADGKLRDAIVTVKADIALPAVLGRICPKPCERACRRAVFDEAVSICLLKRYVADIDLQSADPYLPACSPRQDKRVAIVGAGPAGLSAAYYLLQKGYGCTIFDEHERPGGMLRYGVPRDKLPTHILDNEIALIEKLGAEFQGKSRVGGAVSMEDLRRDFDAVFVAVGQLKPGDGNWLGLDTSPGRIVTNRRNYETNLPGVFAGGDAVRKRRLTVRAVADGKEAAVAIGQYLSGKEVTGPTKAFNTHIGNLKNGEIERFIACASRDSRVVASQGDGGFTDEQARKEAARCLHCDCRKAEGCKLRQYAQEYEAKPRRYKVERRLFEQQVQHPDVIYEPGKCIDCGLCVQITSQARERLGLTFIGRGFDVRVAVPFDRSIAEGLKRTAGQCVAACPTGALAFKEEV